MAQVCRGGRSFWLPAYAPTAGESIGEREVAAGIFLEFNDIALIFGELLLRFGQSDS